MGNDVKNTKLLIIDEKGTVSALEWCEIKDITHHKDMPILYMNNKPVHLKAGICTETVISGERGYLYDIPTCMFESAKKTLDFIIADKRKQEIEEIENELKEMGTPNSARIRCGYAPIGWSTDEKTRELYERYKALKPELFERVSDNLRAVTIDKIHEYATLDVETIRRCLDFNASNNADYTTIFVGSRGAGKTLTNTLNYIKSNPQLFNPVRKISDNTDANHIWINEDKKVVTVKKPDGSVIQVKCDKRDVFDPYVGVALAMVYKEFGSKSAFRKFVDTKVTKQSKKKDKKKPTEVKEEE